MWEARTRYSSQRQEFSISINTISLTALLFAGALVVLEIRPQACIKSLQ